MLCLYLNKLRFLLPQLVFFRFILFLLHILFYEEPLEFFDPVVYFIGMVGVIFKHLFITAYIYIYIYIYIYVYVYIYILIRARNDDIKSISQQFQGKFSNT